LITLSVERLKKPVFFLDRTHGKTIRKWLKAVNMALEFHDHYFLPEEPDPTWIAKCGKEDWIILSGDKRIETVPENRQAAIDAKCKVFFFDDTNSKTEEWAAAVLVGRARIAEIIDRNNGPFFVTLTRFARSHVSRPRYCADGGPKPVTEMKLESEPEPSPKKRVRKNPQRHLWDNDESV
jgi:hypothetical protein